MKTGTGANSPISQMETEAILEAIIACEWSFAKSLRFVLTFNRKIDLSISALIIKMMMIIVRVGMVPSLIIIYEQ